MKKVNDRGDHKGSGFTILFLAYSLMLIESEMPVNLVGRTLKKYPSHIWPIFHHWVRRAYQKVDNSQVEAIGIDETSSKKVHNYLIIGVGMASRLLIHVTKGKTSDYIIVIKNHLEDKETPSEQISKVCTELRLLLFGE